jgi:hypothetical protein
MIGLTSQDFGVSATFAVAPRETCNMPENLPEKAPRQAWHAFTTRALQDVRLTGDRSRAIITVFRKECEGLQLREEEAP